jgi:ubiquinone/menaquinone biosynthesis C-methylase UbiE
LKSGDGFFDIMVSVMVMHHIEAVGGPIAEMSRVLKQGGRLIIADYSPKAHTLDSQSRHNEEDFFEPNTVSMAAKASRLKPRVEDHGKWYLVEATRTIGTD